MVKKTKGWKTLGTKAPQLNT